MNHLAVIRAAGMSLVLFCAGNRLFAADPAGVKFDLDALSKPLAVFPADVAPAEGVKALFYEGAKFKGQPTRVFAYYGAPKEVSAEPGKKVPAMVLIHGGGGTAFDRWVKVWNSRGYAAISMDLCGCVPIREGNSWKRHGGSDGGPIGSARGLFTGGRLFRPAARSAPGQQRVPRRPPSPTPRQRPSARPSLPG